MRLVHGIGIGAALAACRGEAPTDAAPAAAAARPEQVGPAGGWIASLAWRSPTEVWASADDTGGLWRSLDAGRTWSRVASYPQEHATYALRFHPTDPDWVYAPSYAGLGFARSTDGGATFTVHRAGLPEAPNEAVAYDVAADPADPLQLWMATTSGLYRSTDGGERWTLLDPRPATAEAFRPSGAARRVAADAEVQLNPGVLLLWEPGDEGWVAVDLSGRALINPEYDGKLGAYADLFVDVITPVGFAVNTGVSVISEPDLVLVDVPDLGLTGYLRLSYTLRP